MALSIAVACAARVRCDRFDARRHRCAPSVAPRRARIAASSRDDDGKDDGDRDARGGKSSSAKGDAELQNSLERELRIQGRIYRAEKELDEAKDGIAELGDTNKNTIDAEASLVRDRTSLELGMVAGELDAELEAMAEEAKAARERNAAVKRELEALAEELLGKKPNGRRESAPESISEFKARQIDAEADRVGASMQATLEDTQRATAFTLVLLLLSITAVSLLAEGAYDKFFAVGGAIALIGYQARAENAKRSK